MRIAVLSGKGGTGKTFTAVNLAYCAGSCIYADCDVEEPNGFIYFKPESKQSQDVKVRVPSFYEDKCTGCRACTQFCNFNALAFIKGKVKVFRELCHSCGGCIMLCSEGALVEEERIVGSITRGISGKVAAIEGRLNIGEASGVPVIREINGIINKKQNAVIDCPPGSSCTVMESIADSDYCVLVAEPTAFGLHNMDMVHRLVKTLGKKSGVIINKAEKGNSIINDYCKKNGLEILWEIPFEKEIALINSEGRIISQESPKYRDMFKAILKRLEERI